MKNEEYKLKDIILCLIFCYAIALNAFSISGVVKSEAGTALKEVNIYLKNQSKIGTTTDDNGNIS